MCGRYVAAAPASVLAEYFAIDEVREELPGPSWNVAPTDPVPAIVVRRDKRLLGVLRWGLVPSWAKDAASAARTINARAESLATKPAFRTAFARRRCLLPADGFYEWERRPDGSRRPWFFHRADGAPLALAGLWELWRDPSAVNDEAALLRSCAVVTVGANALVGDVHDRMPAVLDARDWDLWLDPHTRDLGRLASLLGPADPRMLDGRVVGPRVNRVANNDPSLVEPAGGLSGLDRQDR